METMFTTQQQKSVLVVTVTAPSLMSMLSVRDIQPELYKLIDEQGNTKVVMDLSKVRDISSQFIGTIIAMHTKLSRKRGKLVLCGLNDKLSELMALTRLDRVISIVPTAKDAIERDWVLG